MKDSDKLINKKISRVTFPNCLIYPDTCRKNKCPAWRSLRIMTDSDQKEKIYENYSQCIFLTFTETAINKWNPEIDMSEEFRTKDNYMVTGDTKDPPEVPF